MDKLVDIETERFVELMTEHQGRIYGYLLTLAGDPDAANDILQETNVVLWTKWRQFTPGTSFKSWSFRVAHFQFMAFRQRRLRDRIFFSDELLQTLAAEASTYDEHFEDRRAALENCVRALPPRSQEAIRYRYAEGLSVAEISLRLGRHGNAVYQILYRARQLLIECVRQGSPIETPT